MKKKAKKEDLEIKIRVIEEIALDNKRQFLTMIDKRLKSEEYGMSKYQLSKLSGVSESTISRYFSQETDISITNFFKICHALKFNPYLIPFELDTEEFNTFDAYYNEYLRKTYLKDN
ncbi:helix-turn-helix transcriptional regulator [Psychroserpens sp. AS72]|uniref:helix-turn-helix domain-containing protein n=1 Tax=Psychroserpens sp. AS72 TaxID=3135775 RepID=UPI0031800CBA